MGCGFLYFGSLIYSNRGTIYAPESVGLTGGRIVCTSAGSEVLYHVTDYLGSVRVVSGAGTGRPVPRGRPRMAGLYPYAPLVGPRAALRPGRVF